MSDKYFSSRGEYLFSDRLEREDKEFRDNMRLGYKNLVEKTENAYLLDADSDVEDIHHKVIELLKKHHITDLCPSKRS
jgi:dTMP kinase